MTDKDWSKQVLGGGTYCEICGISSTGPYFQPHHYIHRSQSKKLRNEIRNGCRICSLCHDKAHKEPSWFAKEFHKLRPCDKEYCDREHLEDNKIKGVK